MTDIDKMSLPITYIDYYITNNDNIDHKISLYYDNSGEVAINDVKENIVWDMYS